MGISPLHASTVGLILNPNTNRISPQFHCVYDDYFETVLYKEDNKPPPMWDELIINSRFRNDLDDDDSGLEDTWEKPTIISDDFKKSADTPGPMGPIMGKPAPDSSGPMDPMGNPAPGSFSPGSMDSNMRNPVPDVGRPMPDKVQSPLNPPQTQRESTPQRELPFEPSSSPENIPPLRRSTRVRKPVDRFKFDKAHGYSSIKRFSSILVKSLCAFHSVRQVYDANYVTALALDPTYGLLEIFGSLSPDFLNRNQWMFKSKTKHDQDTPGIREALTGEHQDEFIQGMANEIAELEKHGTWQVINRSEIKPVNLEDGTE